MAGRRCRELFAGRRLDERVARRRAHGQLVVRELRDLVGGGRWGVAGQEIGRPVVFFQVVAVDLDGTVTSTLSRCECRRPGRIGGVSTATASYKGHRYPVEIINHCVWLYFRFPLSFRERGADACTWCRGEL